MSQLCVWPGTVVDADEEQDFIKWMKDQFGVVATPLNTIETKPDMKDGEPVPGTGGRMDFVFAIRDQDVAHFAIPRLGTGISWFEDYLDHSRAIVPDKSLEKIRELEKELDSEPEADASGA